MGCTPAHMKKKHADSGNTAVTHHPLSALSSTNSANVCTSESCSFGPNVHFPCGVQPLPTPYILPLPLQIMLYTLSTSSTPLRVKSTFDRVAPDCTILPPPL
eukprot:TRINITY_DN45438_c0_g1_i1.p1 TRINITY_DN45438_c0_g1~~TRINITY_DN45438_c0_g1_i1.p1  ORF type:complete len:102 (-),score=3.03 TRINITY_DN45438_c0_g1_i1:41-346(-)